MRRSVLAGICALTFSVSVHAAPIYEAVSVTATRTDFGGAFALVNMINQSGLSAGFTSGVTDFATVASGTTHDGGSAFNSGFSVGPFGQFSFDLGSVLSIDGLAFWETQNSGSVLRFDLYSDADQDWANGGVSLLGSFTATASGAAISAAQVFSFGAVSTQFLQLDIITTAGGDQPGIGEIAFRGTVPEPTSLALLGLALAGLGFARSRRLH